MYRRTSALAEKQPVRKQEPPQATTKTTSFGFRLGKFGLDFQQQKTTLDPSFSHTPSPDTLTARAFNAEAEVETLRASVGMDGASYRNQNTDAAPTSSISHTRIRTALSAYARNAAPTMPSPGAMLASVV
nr:hypothetical protein [Pseudodesulfovibrio sp. JC047]